MGPSTSISRSARGASKAEFRDGETPHANRDQGLYRVKSAANGTAEEKFGRIPNPVVHVALNQIRKTANAYLELYGKPTRISIELARDMSTHQEALGDSLGDVRPIQ